MAALQQTHPECHFIVDQIRSRIAQGNIEVPLLPEVAGKVVRLTQDPDSDAAALSQLIQSDQPLAAHVMRIANSAAYSPNASMVSLQQAITRLGMRVISEIALAASINGSLFNTPGYEAHIQYILKCSLAAGLWAKETARACRKNVEAAFLSGLLNDIGRPIAVQVALEISAKDNIEIDKQSMTHIEKAVKKELSLAVLDAWEMPSAVKNVVNYFDHYADEHPAQIQTIIVVAGSSVAYHFYCDSTQDLCPTKEELLNNPVFADINLYQDEISSLLEKSELIDSAMEAMGL